MDACHGLALLTEDDHGALGAERERGDTPAEQRRGHACGHTDKLRLIAARRPDGHGLMRARRGQGEHRHRAGGDECS